jgi:ketosteroid isomerase-like protein
MELLLEDPTYLAGGLAILGVAFLLALRVTQQGRYLIWALTALGLAGAVLVIEHFWVTDAEQIERVVYDLRDAVVASDAERVLSHLTPDVEFVQQGHTTSSGEATRNYIRSVLSDTKFDFVRISHLKAEASRLSRLGSAEFRIIAGGSIRSSMVTANFGTTNSDWSLGFAESNPGVWKVTRISPTQVPSEMPRPQGSNDSGSSGERHRRGRNYLRY